MGSLAALESIQGDFSISWQISLMSGLSLVILGQIIQDYDLMGSVKSDGRHQWPFSRIHLQNAVHFGQTMNQ